MELQIIRNYEVEKRCGIETLNIWQGVDLFIRSLDEESSFLNIVCELKMKDVKERNNRWYKLSCALFNAEGHIIAGKEEEIIRSEHLLENPIFFSLPIHVDVEYLKIYFSRRFSYLIYSENIKNISNEWNETTCIIFNGIKIIRDCEKEKRCGVESLIVGVDVDNLNDNYSRLNIICELKFFSNIKKTEWCELICIIYSEKKDISYIEAFPKKAYIRENIISFEEYVPFLKKEITAIGFYIRNRTDIKKFKI